MKHDPRLKLAIHTDTKPTHRPEETLAAMRARTVMEVMRERSELTRNLYDVFGPGDEREVSRSLLRLPGHRTTH
jgi:hypothetical protein